MTLEELEREIQEQPSSCDQTQYNIDKSQIYDTDEDANGVDVDETGIRLGGNYHNFENDSNGNKENQTPPQAINGHSKKQIVLRSINRHVRDAVYGTAGSEEDHIQNISAIKVNKQGSPFLENSQNSSFSS